MPAFRRSQSVSQPDTAVVVRILANALTVRYGTTRFTAWPAKPLVVADLKVGDTVAIRWSSNTAYATNRLNRMIDRTATVASDVSTIPNIVIEGNFGSTDTNVDLTAGPDIVVNNGTIGRSGNVILLFNAAGVELQQYAATSAGLDAASAVAIAGDQILLPVITITGNHTLTAGIHYAGISRRGTILSGQITGSAGASLERLSVTRTASDATKLCAVVGPTSGALHITDCELSATQSGAGTGYAVSVQAGDVYIYNSRAYGSTAMTDEA